MYRDNPWLRQRNEDQSLSLYTNIFILLTKQYENVILLEGLIMEISSNFWRPSLLASPNIPKPLHTLNPRTILGRWWWDEQRQKAYAKHDYRCWACGVPKINADFHKWLEAHEDYNIEWETGRIELREIVALCHSCHNFIHSGRLYSIYQEGHIGKDGVRQILEHGFGICERNNVQPYFGAFMTLNLINGQSPEEAIKNAKKKGWFPTIEAPWENWHLVIEGQKHYSPFKNLLEWEQYWV